MNGVGINNTVASNNPTQQQSYSIGSNDVQNFKR
jgi:hypothetical protein